MTELFYAVLKASFQGSIVILAVILLRLALKKAPKSVFCLLWLLAGLRLVLPFEIESKLSLQPQLQEQAESIQITLSDPVTQPDLSVDSVIGEPEKIDLPEGTVFHTAHGNPVGPVDPEPSITLGDIATQIWLLGMGLMVLASLWSYLKLKRRVRMAYLTENGCFECPGLETAFVLGFLPPRIYLPAGLSEGEKKFIFDHENTHIARGDHWYKLLGYLVLSFHWFNPLVWVGYSLLCRDIELACDEHVVKFMSLTERKAYSAALLSCGGHTAGLAACPVAFGESNPKKRILNVLNYKRPGFWVSLAAVIAVILVAVCLLTSPGNPSLLEFGNVADAELHDIGISTETGLVSISDPDDIREIEKLLKSISWEDEMPEEQPEKTGSYGILFNSLLAEDALYFSGDCSLVWAEGTQAYPVSDGRKLREYLDNLSEAVWNRETSGAPFADIHQPVQWLRGITENAVREAEIYVEQPTVQEGNTSSTSRSMGVLSARDFETLLDILNGLPESAIVSESTLRRQSFGTLAGSLTPHGGMTLTVYDDVNQLVMVLRLVKEDVIEFILIDELDKVADGVTYLDHPQCWILENDALLAFLKEMQAHPMIISPITYFEHDTSDDENLRRCREAMLTLKNSEELYLYITNLDDPMETTNVYMHASNGWLFKYRRPGWDWEEVQWLRIGNEQYIYGGHMDDNGVMTTPYYWQVEPNPESHDYRLPYPFDLDWENIELVYDGTAEDFGFETVSVLFPSYLDKFDFHFSPEGELLYFDVGDSSGEPEATTSRFYVSFPYDGTVADYLTGLYKEASAQAGKKPATPDTAFYQELLSRKTDGHYTEQWVYDLFKAFYAYPAEFVSYLAQSGRAQEIVTHMGYNVNYYAPYRFAAVLTQLREDPNTDQNILAMLEACLNGGSQTEDYLEKCRGALETYQAQGSWVILVENTFAGDGAMNSYSTALWHIDGQDWHKQAITGSADFTSEHCYLKTAGKTYCRENHTIHDPANGEGFSTGWTEDSQYADMPLPWPLTFTWDEANLEYVQTETWDRGEKITITVRGSLYEGEQRGNDSYQVTLWLTEKGELWSIDISYTEKDGMGETINVRSIITPNAAAPEEAANMIELKYQEALSHCAGTVCNDPACTDASHDHSNVTCTDAHCTNSTHHHDEHHH